METIKPQNEFLKAQPENQELSKSALKKAAKAAQKEQKAAEKAAKQHGLSQQKVEEDVDYAAEFYGPLPLNQSQSRRRRSRDQLGSLSRYPIEQCFFQARIQSSQKRGSLVFLILRQRTETVQGVLAVTPKEISREMVRWAANLNNESVVLVEGVVRKPPHPVKNTSNPDIEVHISTIYLIAGPQSYLPFTVEDANCPDNRVLLNTRLSNRVVDLRTQTNQAIFKLNSGIGHLFHEYLRGNGFLEIHSPKLQAAPTEWGTAFKVNYFSEKAFLAQSPQLAKQMAIAADFERVYEIGPAFRSEAISYRHMPEFIGLDLEMAFEEHYYEVLEMLDEMLKHVFSGLREKYRTEIESIRKQFPAEDFKWREGPEGTLILQFKEAVEILVEDGVPREHLEDLSTENEKRLGRLVKAKYDTDYYIIEKFPIMLRPFYTMPDLEDPTLSNSYDFFMRGEEILSGSQRIHEPKLLSEAMLSKGVNPDSLKFYVDAFRMGCPPHGGGGIGMERVLTLFLKLNNIRRASLFPSDPWRLEP